MAIESIRSRYTPQLVESRRLMGLIRLVSSRPAPRASGLSLVTQEHAMI